MTAFEEPKNGHAASHLAQKTATNGNNIPLNSTPAFELEAHPVDTVQPMKVGVIGAGLAGITAGILIPAKVPGLDLRIYEKNADVVSLCYSGGFKMEYLPA